MRNLERSKAEVRRDSFKEAYYYSRPLAWRNRIQEAVVKTRGEVDPDARGDEEEKFCIVVLIKKSLPARMRFPADWRGLKVYIEII